MRQVRSDASVVAHPMSSEACRGADAPDRGADPVVQIRHRRRAVPCRAPGAGAELRRRRRGRGGAAGVLHVLDGPPARTRPSGPGRGGGRGARTARSPAGHPDRGAGHRHRRRAPGLRGPGPRDQELRARHGRGRRSRPRHALRRDRRRSAGAGQPSALRRRAGGGALCRQGAQRQRQRRRNRHPRRHGLGDRAAVPGRLDVARPGGAAGRATASPTSAWGASRSSRAR